MVDETDYQVGYKRPPRHRRFRKGVSGNPKGRPKGTLNIATLFWKILHQKIRVNGPDGSRLMPKLEVTFNQLINRGLKGDPKAVREVVHYAQTFGDAGPALVRPIFNIRFDGSKDDESESSEEE
jgi:hypothetical protein